MIITKAMNVSLPTDAELVGETLSGNRDAFAQIVARYQSLVCALAYSATGSLGQSEDLAQETFITAWKHLAHLRERDKLRSWLGGIARNCINNFLRREGREPVSLAGPLEHAADSHAAEPLPPEHLISREEQAILWRALQDIPEIYRAPLVLYYREHQSVERVAQALELSEDTVHQRLSRGRRMLHEHVLAFIEGSLGKTGPGKAFTLAVLASLSGLTISTKAAAAGTAAPGSATVKAAGAMGLWNVLLGPLAVVLPNYLAYRVSLAGAQSDEERRYVRSLFGRAGLVTAGLFIPFAVAALWLTRGQSDHSFLSGLFSAGLVFIYLPAIWFLGTSGRSRRMLTEILTKQHAGVLPQPAWEYRSRLAWLGLPLVHIRIGDRFSLLKKPVKAWIAMGDRAIGGLFAFGGIAVAPVSIGGISLGMLSVGGLSAGVLAVGGIALGIWSFLGLAIGWEAVGGIAIAWRAAVGDIALAHHFAHGTLAFAAQANTSIANHFIHANSYCSNALFVLEDHRWLWLNLLWIIPFLIRWWIVSRHKPKATTECQSEMQTNTQ